MTGRIIDVTEHRPWPMPRRPWVMAQSWHDLLFAHWPLPVEMLRAVVPSVFSLDTFEGQAWIGVVPFRMSGVRPRAIPALPWLSAFPELNVRTYVTLGGKPGVYFFSLDAGNPVAVAVARRWFHLPYFRARMALRDEGGSIHYRSDRTHRGAPAATFVGRYRPSGEVFRAEPGTLEHFLTERYALYTMNGQRLYRGEIHHVPWPLQLAEAEIEVNTVVAAHGLTLPPQAPLLHFARRLDVIVWPLEQVYPDPSPPH